MGYTGRVIKLRNFLKGSFDYKIQAYNTPNTVGDKTITVYAEDSIIVKYCPLGEYLDILGLTVSEFESLGDILDIVK